MSGLDITPWPHQRQRKPPHVRDRMAEFRVPRLTIPPPPPPPKPIRCETCQVVKPAQLVTRLAAETNRRARLLCQACLTAYFESLDDQVAEEIAEDDVSA